MVSIFSKNFYIYVFWWGIATIIDLCALWFFHEIIQYSIFVATILAFLISAFIWFFYHRFITFKNHYKKNIFLAFVQFIWVNITTQLLYMFLLYVFVDVFYIYYLYAAIWSKWITFVLNYIFHNFITFGSIYIPRYVYVVVLVLINMSRLLRNEITAIKKDVVQKMIQYHIVKSDTNMVVPNKIDWAKWLTRYQIIPDRWENWDKKNDSITISSEWWKMPIDLLQKYRSYYPERYWDRYTLSNIEIQVYQYLLNNNWKSKDAYASILRNRWYGWDFKWMREKMNYLADLWIWWVILHPIWKSNTPMRYEVSDYNHVDPRLSSLSNGDSFVQTWWTYADVDFLQMVKEFHEKNIKVALDIAFTYSSIDSVLIQDVAQKWKKSLYYNWFEFYELSEEEENSEQNKNNRCVLSNYYDKKLYPEVEKIYYNWRWNLCHLIYAKRDINHTIHPWLEDYYKAILKKWIMPWTVNGVLYSWIDAIRFDAFPELPIPLKESLYTYIKTLRPDLLIIWEDWSNEFNYIKYQQTNGLTNYFARTITEAFIINRKDSKLLEQYFSDVITSYYAWNDLNYWLPTWTYINSHDTDRIASKLNNQNRELTPIAMMTDFVNQVWYKWHFIRDDPKTNKNQFGTKYYQGPPVKEIFPLLRSIIQFVYMLPGANVVYYGEEKWMWWWDDPDNRKPMLRDEKLFLPQSICNTTSLEYCAFGSWFYNWFSKNSLFQDYQTLINLKKQYPSIRYGSIDAKIPIYSTNDEDIRWIIVFSRKYQDEMSFFISNQKHNGSDSSVALSVGKSLFTLVDPFTKKQYVSDENWWVYIDDLPVEQSIILVEQK